MFPLLMMPLFHTCRSKKNDIDPGQRPPVRAGKSSSHFFTGIYNDPLPVRPFESCETSPSGQVACGIKTGILQMDLDEDGTDDITFASRQVTTMANRGGVEAESYCTEDYHLCPEPLAKGSIISNRLNWAMKTSLYPSEQLVRHLRLSYRTGDFIPYAEHNPWSESAYLAVRRVVGVDTTFGWIKLQVADFHIIRISGYALQK